MQNFGGKISCIMEDVQVAYVKMKFLLAVHNYHQISLTIDPGLQQVKKLATHDRYSPIQTNHAKKLRVMGAGGVGGFAAVFLLRNAF